MRAGYVTLGLILTIAASFMILMTWPLIEFETEGTFDIDDVEPRDRIRYVGEITRINEFGGLYELELDYGTIVAFTDSEGFELEDRVVVTIVYGENLTNWDESTYTVEKIPTTAGIMGLLILIASIVLTIAGASVNKASLEDFVEFDVTAPAPSPAEQESRVENITCPKCKKIFGVKEDDERPMKIRCPHCGVEGVLK